jgi:hypothetical protein
MKYIVSRTSSCIPEPKPCENAVYETIPCISTDKYSSFDEYKKKRNQNYLAYGYDHKEHDGFISRVYDSQRWTIELSDLELIEFIKKNGRCIVDYGCNEESIPELEIYDDYRE